MKKRTARITVETERLLVINRSHAVLEGWCDACAAEVKLIGIDQAAAIANASQRALFRRAEAGEIHFMESDDGRLMFCLTSVSGQNHEDPRKLLRS